MKKCILVIGLLIFISAAQMSIAANFQYSVNPAGANQYTIQIHADTPQMFSIFLDVFYQKSREVCGGEYRVLEIDPGTTRMMTGLIACQNAQQPAYTPPPAARETTPGQQYPQPAQQPPAQQPRQYPQPAQQPPAQQPRLYPSPDGDTPAGGTRSNTSLISPARSSDYNSLARRFGVGIWGSVWNLGIGPSVEFYPLNNIGIMGTLGALFDYTSASVRGMFLLPSMFQIEGFPLRPYVGAGYVHIWGPELDILGDTFEQNGDGFEIYGGMLFSAEALLENLYVRGEFIYSNIDIDHTINGQTIDDDYSDYLDWNTFSIGMGISWFF